MTVDIQRVTNLMQEDRKSWNVELIQVEFPKYISKLILSIPICNGEHDSFVWCPSVTGDFFVRSAYRANNKERFSMTSNLDRQIWTLL